MTWEIVAGLITLISVSIALGGVLAKLVRTLTKLEVTLAALDKSVGDFKITNDAEHTKINIKLDNHEGRIVKLEHSKE